MAEVEVTTGMLDFSSVDVATSNLIKPGQYNLAITGIKLEKSTKKGTPYLNITFETKDGRKITSPFYITGGALPRLQSLHKGFLGRTANEAFTSPEGLFAYFEKNLINKTNFKPMKVYGRQLTNGKVLSDFDFSDLFVEPTAGFVEREYEEDSAEYKRHLKIDRPSQDVSNNNSAIVNTPMWDAPM